MQAKSQHKLKNRIMPFKLGKTNDIITANAGLSIFGEFLYGIGLNKAIDENLPRPGSNRGYLPSKYVMPLILMLNGGGRALEDIREISNDIGLRELLNIANIPSSDAYGLWLRRTGRNGGLERLQLVNNYYFCRYIEKEDTNNYTLDLDATGIKSEKEEAKMSYKGFKGYMPLLGHIAENGLVILDEFREGNISPSTNNLEFIRKCVRLMPPGKKIKYLRADSASYQSAIFNECESSSIKFVIGAKLDTSVKAAINNIKEEEWKSCEGFKIAETVHSLEKTKKSFRLIVIRYPYQKGIFEKEVNYEEKYTAIATNIPNSEMEALEVKQWYNGRGEYSENRIKELKNGFSMERMPCGDFKANAVFFRIGVLSYNLFKMFQLKILPKSYRKHQIKTIRWKLYNIAGKIVYSGGIYLKVRNYIYELFEKIRNNIYNFCCSYL